MGAGEDQLITWLRRKARDRGASEIGDGEIGDGGISDGEIGDDAALLAAGGPIAVTVDTQIEGVHFLPGLAPEILARRLLAVNLSDLAAVGAEPRWALLALAAPADFPHRPFFAALLAACRQHGLRLVGGDLAASDRLTAVLTLAGGQAPGQRWVRRSAGRAGDGLWLGGPVGESALGRLLLARGAVCRGRRVTLPPGFAAPRRLRAAARRCIHRHLAPQPQLALGSWLAGRPRAAAIDLSDGLALDLSRLCRASGTGGRIDLPALALPGDFQALARDLSADPEQLALSGGEDYVLLFALPAAEVPPPGLGCRKIGELLAGRALRLRDAGGERALAAAGWDHLQRAAQRRQSPPSA